MIIRFGLAFDGLRPRLPENPVDDVVLGPAGLLGVLESQLGLPPVSAQPGEALLAYRTCLEEADAAAVEPRFYRRSLAVDPVGVARALLAWREQWYEAGWDGTFAGGAPARLADLAAVEQLAMDRVPRGRGQRLQQVAAALVERSTQIERIELHDDPDDLPAVWHTVLRHLEVRSAPGVEPVARAEAGTDLRRVQARLLELYRQDEGVAGKREALQGDGSLVVVRGVSRDLSAQAVGEHLRKGEQLGETVLIAERDGIILDNALERVGLPRCGFQHYTRSRGVTEVMRLGLALIWTPVDPHRLLQFLVHPVGPLPRRVRGRLADVVAARPGVGGAAWRAALDEIAARQRESGATEAQAAALRAEIDYWLAGPRYSPEEGAPLDVLMERTRRCVEWIGRRLRTVEGHAEQTLFAAALGQGEALTDGLTRLRDDGRARLPRMELERLVDEVTADAPDPATFQEAGRVPAASDPSAVTGAWDTVIWWDLAFPSRQVDYPWSTSELVALRAHGVELPAVAERLRARSRGWLRPILNAIRRLVLVVHENEKGHHPLWTQIENCFEGLPILRVDEALLEGRAPLPVLELAARPLPVRSLPVPRRWWRLPDDTRLEPRETESYSSLVKLSDYPHEWVLRYSARLRPGRASEVSDQALLYGNLGHRLLEVFFSEQLHWRELGDAAVSEWLDARLAQLLQEEGAVLLEPGRGVDRQQVITTLERALHRLLAHLLAADIRTVTVEKWGEALFGDIRLQGATDLLLTDAAGRESVVDVKWSGDAYRGKELAANRHLQLATYAYLRKTETGSARWPPHAYFILKTGNLLAQNAGAFPTARLYPAGTGEGVDGLWGRVESTYAWRRGQLGAGRVEVVTEGAELDEQSVPPDDALPAVAGADPFDDFRWLTGWDPFQ